MCLVFLSRKGVGSRFRQLLCVLTLLFLPLVLRGREAESPQDQALPLTPLPESPPEAFSFLVYGDIQKNHQRGHDRLVEQMLRESAHAIFNTGDISADKGRHYRRDFLPVVEPLASRAAFFPAVGNHDIDWGSPASRQGFIGFFRHVLRYLGEKHDNPHLLEPGSQKLWYRLRYGKVLFVVLDSNLFIDEGRYRSTHRLAPYQGYRDEQLRWLERILAESSRDPSIRGRFLFFHHSPIISSETVSIPLLGHIFGIGGHPGHRRMMVNQSLPGAEERYLLDLFRYFQVTAVFTGHEHYYERWREVIEENDRPARVLNWVVTGLGGVRPRGRPKHRREEIQRVLEGDLYRGYLERVKALNPAWTARLEHSYPTETSPSADFHHYVAVTVEADEVRFETKDTEGRVRDRGVFRFTTTPAN